MTPEPLESDDLVIVRMRGGDVVALEILMRRYYAALVGFVEHYVRSADVAEDVVHELFVRLWERRDHLEFRVPFRAYLYTAARNAALKHLRGAGRRTRAEAVAGQWGGALNEQRSPPDLFDVEAEAHAATVRATLQRAVDDLPPRCREIFMMSRSHHLSYGEISALLGISASTVRTQMARALAALEAALGAISLLLIALLNAL